MIDCLLAAASGQRQAGAAECGERQRRAMSYYMSQLNHQCRPRYLTEIKTRLASTSLTRTLLLRHAKP